MWRSGLSFFASTLKIDYYNDLEFLLRTYQNIDFFFSMDVSNGFELLNTMKEKERRRYAFELYKVDRATMTKETYLSFEDYYQQFYQPKKIDLRPKEEIQKDIKKIRQQFNQRM